MNRESLREEGVGLFVIFDCSCNFSSNRKDWRAFIIEDDKFVCR